MLPGIQEGPYADDDPARTMIVPFDDPPTTVVPVVRAAAPRGLFRSLLPWLGFGLVAVLVVIGAVSWASSMRGPQAPTTVLGESPASAAAPAAPLPAATGPVPDPAPLAQSAATAKRTAPTARRTPSKPRLAAPPAPAAPVPAPAPVAPTTTTAAALFPLPGWPFGPNCTDPATAASEAACKTADPAPKAAGPKAADPKAADPKAAEPTDAP